MSDDKKEKPEKDKKEKAPKKGGTFLGWLLICLPIILGLGFFYTPLFMIAVLMAPAWFALLSDTGEDRALAVCVGSGTLAGAMFYLSSYMLQPPPFQTALMLVQQPFSWIYPLMGSGFGAMIFYMVPMLMIESVYAKNLAMQKMLEEQQKKLIEEWGDGVKG